MEISISSIPTFCSIFLLPYVLGYFIVFRNWGPKHRTEASSCLMSLAHGTPVVFMAIHTLLNSPNSLDYFASPNTASQNTVLEYSMVYFLVDTLHYILFFPNDILFICHHLATLYVFATCRFVVFHGGSAILVLLVLAEVTSACQNVWSMASLRRGDVPAANKLYGFLCLPFYVFYSVVRGILGPLFVWRMGVFYMSGVADNVIPRWAWGSWMTVIATAILVSILWVLNNWIEWFRERSFKAQKKVR